MRALLVTCTLTLSLLACRPEANRVTLAPGSAPVGAVPVVSSGGDPSVTARRVWAGERVDFTGSPTPDGRFLTFTDWWTTGDLALRDLARESDRRITANPGGTYHFADRSVVSPDGKTVAYNWLTDAGYELRVIGLDGARARILLAQDDATTYLEPGSWSADGQQLTVALHRRDGSKQIAVVSVGDGGVRVLKSLDWRSPQGLQFSPDGRWIAYDFPPDRIAPPRDLYLMAADGSREVRLTDDEADDRVLGWLPDGGGLLFHSDRGGSEAIWRLPINSGRPAAEPTLLRADVWRLAPIGWSRDRYFYGVTVQQGHVHVAAVDFGKRLALDVPVPVSAEHARGATADWSPDGMRLAYMLRPGGGNAQPMTLAIHSLETGEIRELATPLDYVQGLRWTRDGSGILLSARHQGRRGIFRFDLGTAVTRPVALADSGGNVQRTLEVSPDGRTLYFVRGDRDSAARLVAHDLASGRERTLYTHDVLNISASPDNRWVAFTTFDPETKANQVMVMAAEGGEPRVLQSVRAPVVFHGYGGLPWTPDGRFLLAVRADGSDPGGNMELVQIPVAGAKPPCS